MGLDWIGMGMWQIGATKKTYVCSDLGSGHI